MPDMNTRARPSHGAKRQAGAATLVVVMVLFFIMAMMAAFASRNLIFEQRIASNYYRSGVALEAADAGAEWTLSMLNGINVDETCQSAGTPSTSFRERYLNISPSSRSLSPVLSTTAASCVRVDGQGWVCQCPESGWTDAVIDDAPRMQPSFAISLQPAGRPGVVRVLSSGCTSSQSATCRTNQFASSNQQLGAAVVRIEAALVSALKMPPAVPLTIKQTISGASNLGLHNTDPDTSGLLMVTGGAEPTLTSDRLDSLPGTPGQQALISNDASLNNASADGMFKMFFGMSPNQYQNQPAARRVVCQGNCSAALAAAYARGARIIWVDSAMELASNIELGTTTSPLIVIANGPVTLNGPMRINGLIYARGDTAWSNNSGQLALLNGALIGEGHLQIAGIVDLWYQASIMSALSNATGSFVRVPGSWWDASGN